MLHATGSGLCIEFYTTLHVAGSSGLPSKHMLSSALRGNGKLPPLHHLWEQGPLGQRFRLFFGDCKWWQPTCSGLHPGMPKFKSFRKFQILGFISNKHYEIESNLKIKLTQVPHPGSSGWLSAQRCDSLANHHSKTLTWAALNLVDSSA